MRGLLEVLASRAQCAYLSDLPLCRRQRLTRQDIASLPEDAYSLWEWNDALGYLLGEGNACLSACEARDCLMGHLPGERD